MLIYTIQITNTILKETTLIDLTSTNLKDAKKELSLLLTEYKDKDGQPNCTLNLNIECKQDWKNGRYLGSTLVNDFYLKLSYK